MTNDQTIQQPEVVETPVNIETVAEITIDPIYRHKDGRIFTKKQLIAKMGLTEDRIKDGLSKGMITQVGDTDDPEQQFKHKDGRVFSMKDFSSMGVDKERLASGIEKGMIFPIEKKSQVATPPPPLETQQPKPEVSSTGVAAGESASTTPPPAEVEVPVTTEVAPPPPPVEIVKTDFSVTPLEKTKEAVQLQAPLQAQQSNLIVKNDEGQDQPAIITNPNEPVPSVEETNKFWDSRGSKKTPDINIFDNANEYDKLKTAKKIVVFNDGGDPEYGGGAYEAEVDDEEATKRAKEIKQEGLSKKIDYDAVATIGKQIDEYYKDPQQNKNEKQQLSEMYLSGDMASFDYDAARITFLNQLVKGLGGHFHSDETVRITSNYVSPYFDLFQATTKELPDGTVQIIQPSSGNKIPIIQSVYNNLKSELEFKQIENKEEILDNFRKMVSRDFANQAINHPEYTQVDPLSNSGLNENQIIGFNYITAVAPEEIGKYRAALIPDSDIGDNWRAKTAKQQALKALTQIGINIVAPTVNEKLKNEISEYNDEVTAFNKNYYFDATPDFVNEMIAKLGEREKRISKLSSMSSRFDRDLTNLNDGSKYGYANYYERQGLLQELTEQKRNFITQPLLKLADAIYNTGATVVDLVKRPFLTDRENEVNLATLIGTNIVLSNELKVVQRNQMEKVPYVMTPSFQAAYDDIMNNKSLSIQARQDKVYDLIISDPNGIQVDPKGKESNLTISSLWYGMTNLAVDLAPYIAIESLSGGMASGGVAPSIMRKFSSSFIAAFTTGYHQSYIDAISRGSANPYQDALRATVISSLAMGAAGTPSIMKNIIGTKSVIGKMINKMTDKEINAVLRKQPPALLAFRKAYDITGKVAGATKEGFKGAVKMVTLTTAAAAINDQMYGDVRDIEEYIDGGKLEVLKFTLFGGITGGIARGYKEKYGDLTKSTIYEAAANPKKFLEALEIKIKNYELSKEDADQIRNNIEQASKIYKSTYFGFTPQKMDAKAQKEQYDALIQQGVSPEAATKAVAELVQKKAQEQPLDDAGKRSLLFLKMQEADLEKTLKNDLPEAQTKKLTNRLLNIKEQINDLRNGIEAPEREQTTIDVLIRGEVIPGDIIKNKTGGVAKVVKVNENKSVLVENLNTGEKFLWKPEDIETEIIDKPLEVKPIPVLGPPKPPAPAPEKQTQKQKAPEPDSNIMVGDVIDKGGSYNGKKGIFYLEDQTVVFKEEGTGKEYDLGYINDIKDTPINQFGIKHEESVVSLNEDGTFTIRGKVLKNGYSDPTQAVVKDTEGNVVSVTLDMPNGQKRTFKGNVAEDIAYQIHLKEITKDNATTTEFEEFINEPDTKQQIDNATVPATTETTPVTTTETVQRETLQPTAAEPATTEPTIKAVEREVIVKRMKPFTDKMVEIEREFQNQGYEIDVDYDNEITVTNKDGELVEAEDLPKNLRELAGQYEATTAKAGSEVEFKTVDQKTTKGIKIEIPGLEAIDTILVQDGMTYEVYELATGMKLGDTENAMSPADAVKTIADKIPQGLAQRILQKLYESEEASRYSIAREKKGVSITNQSPAYNAFKQQKIAEAENRPFANDEKTRNEILKMAVQARADGYDGAATMIESMANQRAGTTAAPFTVEQAKKTLDRFRVKRDLTYRQTQNIPYPKSEIVERDPSEQGLVNAIQEGYKRDRWNKLPDEIKNAALEAWRKESAIYNKYGYYPSSFKGGEGFFGVMLTLGKYIGAGLSKDPARREARIKEDLQIMKENFKRIDEIYKEEGFDVLKAAKGQTPKPLTITETPLPDGARAAFDRIKNRQQQTANATEVERLRAEEQAEYAAMPDPKDKAKRQKIYDKYDALITPLLKEGEPKAELPQQKGEGIGEVKKKPFSIDNKEDFYHGSYNKREGRLRTNTAVQFGDAIYFTTSKEEAEGNYPHVTKVKLNIENPIYAGEGKWSEVEKLALEKENANKERNDDGKIIGEIRDIADIENSNNVSDAAKELGYDAIILRGEGNHQNETAVLDSNKIIYLEDANKSPERTNWEKEKEDTTRTTQNSENLVNAIETSRQGGTTSSDVITVSTKTLSVNESRFQNRNDNTGKTLLVSDMISNREKNPESFDRVEKIANNWSSAEQDPIHVWTDPKDGKTYVLSGHHRYAGALKGGIENVKIIDRTKDFTEAQAIKFAKEDANTNRAMETPLERAKALRIKKERGDSKEDINNFLSGEGKNALYINNLSALNPNGKTMRMLEQFSSSPDKQTQKETEQRADWIGEAKRTIAGLTEAHENEMFEFLFDKSKSKRITTKSDFLQKVRSLVKPLTPEVPLNIARFEYKTQGESVYEEQVNDLKGQLADRQNQINQINERFNNPEAKGYIPTDGKDYAETRRIADAKIATIEAERKAIQKQLETVYANKGKFTGGESSGTLFSYQETAPKDFEDYVEGVTDILKESPEKTLQQVQADAAKDLGNNTPEFKKLIEQAYNEAKNNLTSRIVKTEVLQKLNKGFLKIGTTIFDNEMQLLNKAKELSGSRFNAIENTAGFETRDGKPLGFNYDTDQVARERFDFSKLTKIGEGSDRIVFDLGNGKVLKVAKTARGLEQNIYEGERYLDFIPEVFERGLNYVVVENINRIKGTDLVPIFDVETGQEIGTVTAAQMFKDLKKFNQGDFDRYNPELQTVLEKYGFADARGYELLYGDFNVPRNWGFKDGKAYLIDAGTLGGVRMIEDFKGVKNLSDPDFRKIYYESRDLKKQYADKDKYTKFHYDENGEILGFTHGGQIYLNGQKITAKTTMEEAGHIWINNAKETNPTLYKAGLKKVVNSQYLKDVMSSAFYKKEARKQGPEGSKAYNDYMQEEALAKAIADEGAKFVTDAQRISFKEWVDKMWNSVMQAFGIRDLTPDQVAKLSLQDFAKMAAADVFAEPKAEAPAPEVKPVIETAPTSGTTTTTPVVDGKVTSTTTTQTPTGERITRTESFTTDNPFLYEGTEERQRGLYTHLMDADNVSGETKDFLKKNGITYQAASNAQAEVLATDIIKAVGKRDALQIARGSDVHASIRSAIYARSIDNAYVAEANAKTPQEKIRAAQEWKDLVTEYANQLTAGGQFTAYAAHFYRTSPMGFVIKENEDRATRFEDWSKGKDKTLEELWSEINATAEGRSMVNLEVEKLKKAEKEAERKIRDKKIDDFFDQLKVNPKNTYGFIIPLSVLNPVIDGMKIAVKAGDRIADVVKIAIEQISEKVGDNWNKEAFRKDYEQMLTNVVGKQKTLSDEAVQLKNRVAGLEKQIADLKDKIAAGGESATKKEAKFSDVPEVQALIEERDRLKKENEGLLKEAKQGKYSDEAKIKAAKQKIVDAIKETERKIDENDLAVKRKTNPTDAELTAYREEQKRLRKELEGMRKDAQEGRYSPAEMAKAEVKRKQARIDELNRRINENDFSAEKQKMEKQKTALDVELEETKQRYDEAKKQSPEFKEKKSRQFLDRLRTRLQGLSERQRNEIVQRSLKQITEAGGLNYEEFRKIVAQSMGYKDLTPAEVKEVESLTETINSVDEAEDNLVNNPTEANLKELDKARQDAMVAGLKLYNKTHRQADIPKNFGSLITGSFLGVVTLGKNIIQNVVMQATVRLPKAVIIQSTEVAFSWLGNKMAGSKIFNPSTNIFLAQEGAYKGGVRGIKRGWFNFYKGTQERDLFSKTSFQSTLAPMEAVKDLKLYFSGEKPLTKTELFERSIRATIGWQPDFILRAMGFGDRPFRWAAEGSAAIQIAKLELKLTADNEVNAFMYAPKKYAYKTLIEQGVPKEEAMLRAAEIEDRIIDAGSKAVLEQENLLSQASKWIDKGLVTSKDDPFLKRMSFGAASILKTATFPFVKIPANVYWQMFKVANPEVALLQGIYHGTKAAIESKNGNKAEAKRQYENMKDGMATAVLGYGAMVAISSLVANGYVRPENDEETKAREREGEKMYERGNQLNWGRMTGGEDYWIDLSWFGPIGTTMAVQAKIQEQNKRKKLKGEAIDDSWAEGLVDRLSISQMEALTNLVYDQASRTIGAVKGGADGLKLWTINSMNTAMNLFTGATYVQMSKSTLPLVPRLKAEGVMEEFKNNQQQRNILYRMFSGMPPSKVSIWGDPIKQNTSFGGVVNNMLGFQETDAHQFGAILYYDAQRTGDMRFFPTAVTDKITVDGIEIKLTQDQKDELATYIGQARKTMVGAFLYDMAYPYSVPVKGEAAMKLSYNDPKMTDKDKIHALEMIYDLGKRSGFAKFQQMHKEFAPAKLTPDQLGEKIKRKIYDFPFKMKLESTLKEKGNAIPTPTEEEKLQQEVDKLNEEAKKQLEENNPE